MELMNEMNRTNGTLDHNLFAYTGQTGPGEPPEDGEMNGRHAVTTAFQSSNKRCV